MPFTIIDKDITKLRVDAVVNAANTSLLMGGGVCGAIFSAAGANELQAACDGLAPIKTGEAVITPGFKLPAKYIVHTAGPVYRDGKQGEEALLRSCYINALKLAVENNCESIAFPLISSGVYGYPKTEAFRIASKAIRDFLDEYDIDVSLAVFDKESIAIDEDILGAIDSYLDGYHVGKKCKRRYGIFGNRRLAPSDDSVTEAGAPVRYDVKSQTGASVRRGGVAETAAPVRYDYDIAEMGVIASKVKDAPILMEAATPYVKSDLDDIIGNLGEPFSSTLMRLIDATGKKDSDVYNRANIDRRLFSKIRSNARYMPGKATILALAVALELSLDQTGDLLERAGFTLSHSRKFDVIVEFFIKSRRYDIYEINEVLFNYNQPLLGG